MGLGHSPRIVTDGLVLCLDAANKRSYPGTGTTWTDLKGENNGTLTNGPTFDSSNKGSIVFDGTNDYINCGNGSEFSITEQITLICWMKKTSNSGYHHLISKFPINNCSYAILTEDNTGYPMFVFSTNGGNEYPNKLCIFSEDVCTGNWTMISGRYNSNTSTATVEVLELYLPEIIEIGRAHV